MRTLLASDRAGARLAVDDFVESAARELAVMAAALRGIDALVFTGDIGENAAVLRQRIVQASAWLGMRPDDEANAAGRRRIDARGSAVRLRVMDTDEEVVICRQALAVTATAAVGAPLY